MRNEKEFDVVKALELARACNWAFDAMSIKEVAAGTSPLNVLHDSALRELVSLYEGYEYVQFFDMESGEPVNNCVHLLNDRWFGLFTSVATGIFPWAIRRYSYRDGFEADTQEEIAKHVVECKAKMLAHMGVERFRFHFYDRLKDEEVEAFITLSIV